MSDAQRNADDILEKLRDLVSNPAHLNEDASALQIRASALFTCLRASNRASNASTRISKDSTTQSRNDMDQSHLDLQNLLYEKRHLEREIEKCRQFASIYQDVPLYTIEDFEKLAPESARSKDVFLDPHQLMLNRLSFELAERQRLDQKKKDLLLQKEELLKESKTKSITMDGVKTQIDTLMKAASEIQKKVDHLVLPVPVPNPDPNTPST